MGILSTVAHIEPFRSSIEDPEAVKRLLIEDSQ